MNVTLDRELLYIFAMRGPSHQNWKDARDHVRQILNATREAREGNVVLLGSEPMTTSDQDVLARLLAFAEAEEHFAFDFSHEAKADTGQWSVMIVFGKEAADSPMAGGAAHGFGDNVIEAIDMALKEAGR